MLNPPNGNYSAVKRNEYCFVTELDDLTDVLLRERSQTQRTVPPVSPCARVLEPAEPGKQFPLRFEMRSDWGARGM